MIHSAAPRHITEMPSRRSRLIAGIARRVGFAALFAHSVFAACAAAQAPAAANEARMTQASLSAWSPSMPTHATTSIVIGGFAIAKSRLALTKFEYGVGKWALISDISRDAVTENWRANATQSASRGAYRLWAGSTALRRYTQPGARGFFLEAGGGLASARLTVTDANAQRTSRTARLPLAGIGAGGRLNLGRSNSFVELGFRSAIPLRTRHLYTDSVPPAGSTRENVSYRSWYFGRGKPSSQLYAGLGISF